MSNSIQLESKRLVKRFDDLIVEIREFLDSIGGLNGDVATLASIVYDTEDRTLEYYERLKKLNEIS